MTPLAEMALAVKVLLVIAFIFVFAMLTDPGFAAFIQCRLFGNWWWC